MGNGSFKRVVVNMRQLSAGESNQADEPDEWRGAALCHTILQ